MRTQTNKGLIRLTSAFVVLSLLLVSPAALAERTAFAGGDGTALSPYQIAPPNR